MTRLKVLLLALFALTAGFLDAAPLKVVTWNLEWFPGKRPTASAEEADAHMKEAKEALIKINPDVFVGVEIRDWASFNELVSAVPGLTTHVVSNFVDLETGRIRPQQIGIASKLKCVAADWEPFKANVPSMARGFSYAALERKDGSLMMVYGNHLKSNGGEASDVAAMRNDQAKQLIAQKEIFENAYGEGNGKETGNRRPLGISKKISAWILTGDFNTNHDGQFPECHVVKELTDAGFRNTWADTPQEKRLTWAPSKGDRFKPTTFDYFFTLGLGDLNATMLESPTEVSDHHAIQLMVPEN